MNSKSPCGATTIEMRPGDTLEPLETPEDLRMAFEVYQDLRGAQRCIAEDKLYAAAIDYLERFFRMAPLIVASGPQPAEQA